MFLLPKVEMLEQWELSEGSPRGSFWGLWTATNTTEHVLSYASQWRQIICTRTKRQIKRPTKLTSHRISMNSSSWRAAAKKTYCFLNLLLQCLLYIPNVTSPSSALNPPTPHSSFVHSLAPWKSPFNRGKSLNALFRPMFT
jgi:hypothetical protein